MSADPQQADGAGRARLFRCDRQRRLVFETEGTVAELVARLLPAEDEGWPVLCTR